MADQQHGAGMAGAGSPPPRDPRYNALRHGLTARTILLREEDAEQFTALRDDLFRQWCPLGESECGSVYELAEGQWRLLRISPMEAELLESLRNPDAPMGGLAAAFLGGRAADGEALLRLMRYRRDIERSYDRALHNLLLLHRVRGVWSKPNLVRPEAGDDDPLGRVNPRWCGPVAGAEPMALAEEVEDEEDDDEASPTVTVKRYILMENGERIPWEEYLARQQPSPERGPAEDEAPEDDEEETDSAEAAAPRIRPKADILRNGPPDPEENPQSREVSSPPQGIPQDRRRS